MYRCACLVISPDMQRPTICATKEKVLWHLFLLYLSQVGHHAIFWEGTLHNWQWFHQQKWLMHSVDISPALFHPLPYRHPIFCIANVIWLYTLIWTVHHPASHVLKWFSMNTMVAFRSPNICIECIGYTSNSLSICWCDNDIIERIMYCNRAQSDAHLVANGGCGTQELRAHNISEHGFFTELQVTFKYHNFIQIYRMHPKCVIVMWFAEHFRNGKHVHDFS